MLFGPSRACDTPSVDLGSLQSYVRPTVTNRGVVMDNDFKFDKEISAVVK